MNSAHRRKFPTLSRSCLMRLGGSRAEKSCSKISELPGTKHSAEARHHRLSSTLTSICCRLESYPCRCEPSLCSTNCFIAKAVPLFSIRLQSACQVEYFPQCQLQTLLSRCPTVRVCGVSRRLTEEKAWINAKVTKPFRHPSSVVV